ncbi:plasmid mobilization relaxosome protein MobC [Salmonella enterica subsp. enterica serovar Derby]|nr:plasmid mobilization relaxosome protein MobC [Salmonella enterica subsp. enterica serovar Derby]
MRLNDAELARLDSQRDAVQMQRGEYLRAAALHRLPPTIPAANREQWAELARTAANLNQIARKVNAGGAGHDRVQIVAALMAIDAGLERLRHAVLETGGDDDR